jgi:plastocyanin
MLMVFRLASILISGGLALALAACGSSSTASGTAISLEAKDFQFSQTTLALPANSTVNLTVKNTGTVHHNFSIKELGVNKDIENPGASETVTFTTKGDATYTFYCEYHGDSKGMKGTATIGKGGPAPAGGSPSPSAPPKY